MSGGIPQRDLKEEFLESRKLYSGCIVCIGLTFHLVSVLVVGWVTKCFSALFDLYHP